MLKLQNTFSAYTCNQGNCNHIMLCEGSYYITLYIIIVDIIFGRKEQLPICRM